MSARREHRGNVGPHGVHKPWYFNGLIRTPSGDSWGDRWHHHSCYWQPVVGAGGAIIVLCHGGNMEAWLRTIRALKEGNLFKWRCIASPHIVLSMWPLLNVFYYSRLVLDFCRACFRPSPIYRLRHCWENIFGVSLLEEHLLGSVQAPVATPAPTVRQNSS